MKFAVFFTKGYALEVEAPDVEAAFNVAAQTFNESEADAASSWEMEKHIDVLE